MPRLSDRLVARMIRIAPVFNSITIHGFGDDEENALRTAHAAVKASSARTRVYLLSADPAMSRTLYRTANTNGTALNDEPTFLRKNTIAGLWHFLTSSVVFYTHGLFGSPRSGPRRLHVLLGHGHGPKSATPNGLPFEYLADLATTNSSTWGRQVILDLGITATDAIAITGNPREDAFDESADRSRLDALGIDPSRPVIVWLPTYRVSDHARFGGWSDGNRLDTMPEYRSAVAALAASCKLHGVTLVTKSHILDAQGVSAEWGVTAVTNDDLAAAGLSLYQFLQLTDGLVSDFSSVWVDYLSAGSSIGLLIHDLDSYSKTRGLNEPHLMDVAGGLVLTGQSIIEEFVSDTANGRVWHHSEQFEAASRIGFHHGVMRADAVIDAVKSLARHHEVSLRGALTLGSPV